MLTLIYDQLAHGNVGYPNLACHPAQPYTPEWRQFDGVWPYVVPLRLLLYLDWTKIPYRVVPSSYSGPAWYPIALGWFDFEIDYFELLPERMFTELWHSHIRVLFYYHEGDNPERIKQRLDSLVVKHQLPRYCYVFVSANSAASTLDQFVYFADHEYFLKYVNRRQSPATATDRTHTFTALNRLHKWWRASCMSDLQRRGLLEHSLWSYNTANNTDAESDNPIELDLVEGWRSCTQEFVEQSPHYCDTHDAVLHNNHHVVNTDLYTQSWCHIVFETHFDADQSNGVFLTEKTFKAIKYGQPFVVVGPAGSLRVLKEMGYRTFDHAIDNSYDDIIDNTQRWLAVADVLESIASKDLPTWFAQCHVDVKHNQQIFTQRLAEPLNTLLEEIECH